MRMSFATVLTTFLVLALPESLVQAQEATSDGVGAVRSRLSPLMSAILERMEEAESSQLALLEQEVEVRRLRTKIEQARGAVDLTESSIKQYREVTLRAEVMQVDAEIAEAEKVAVQIERNITLFRVTKSEPKPMAAEALARAKAMVEAVKQKKRALIDLSQAIKLREFQAKIEEYKSEIETNTILMQVYEKKLARLRFTASFARLTEQERDVIGLLQKQRAAWEKHLTLPNPSSDLDPKSEATLRSDIETLEGRWALAKADRTSKVDGLRFRRINELMPAEK